MRGVEKIFDFQPMLKFMHWTWCTILKSMHWIWH